MIARDGEVIVARPVISGQSGAIVSAELAADRITSVTFEPAAMAGRATPKEVDADPGVARLRQAAPIFAWSIRSADRRVRPASCRSRRWRR
jgi:hypothetical protein